VDLSAALLEASPDGMLLVDPEGAIVVANPAAAAIFGYPLDRLVGMQVEQLIPPEVRAHHVRHRAEYAALARPRPMGIGPDLFAQHADGSMFPVEISLSPIEVEGASHTIAAVRDVSEREMAAAQLQVLEDRERIARDLHDMVIQRLLAAGLGLQASVGAAQPRHVAERIEATIGELDDTIRELRAAIFALGQGGPERSLKADIVSVLAERQRVLGFPPQWTITGPIDELPDHLADQLLATITEGTSNVVRHAQATAATVDVHYDPGGDLTVTIADNGVGLPSHRKTGGGLTNLVWRAAELGGTCTISHREPRGTLLDWRVPSG
jgi:PAS domain S-box-containing protein